MKRPPGDDEVVLPRWLARLLSFGSFLAALFAVFLYSSRTQRRVRDAPGNLESLEDIALAFEAIVEAWRVPGNAVRILQNGDEFFPALLEAIAAAEESVHIESYVWWKGQICEDLAALLARKARDGVEVRVLIDWLGSFLMKNRLEDEMKEAGVRVVKFHGFSLASIGRLNQRDHRKLAIVDGRIGFVFSHGFAEEWEGAGDGPDSWRDTGARVEGPIVSKIQSLFAQAWVESSQEMLAHSRYFPELERKGDVILQLISAAPSGGVSNVSLLYRLIIAIAKEELLIQNPYFAPDHDWVELLVKAVERGVRVRIMVPGKVTDSRLVQYAGHYQFDKLLAGGVEIWEHQRTMIHQKILVVDRCWSHIGSTNFDERSFDINQEVSLGIWNEEIAETLRAAFRDDLEHCLPRELREWRRRPWYRRLADAAAFLVHEQL